jgi:hypothetical protein
MVKHNQACFEILELNAHPITSQKGEQVQTRSTEREHAKNVLVVPSSRLI